MILDLQTTHSVGTLHRCAKHTQQTQIQQCSSMWQQQYVAWSFTSFLQKATLNSLISTLSRSNSGDFVSQLKTVQQFCQSDIASYLPLQLSISFYVGQHTYFVDEGDPNQAADIDDDLVGLHFFDDLENIAVVFGGRRRLDEQQFLAGVQRNIRKQRHGLLEAAFQREAPSFVDFDCLENPLELQRVCAPASQGLTNALLSDADADIGNRIDVEYLLDVELEALQGNSDSRGLEVLQLHGLGDIDNHHHRSDQMPAGALAAAPVGISFAFQSDLGLIELLLHLMKLGHLCTIILQLMSLVINYASAACRSYMLTGAAPAICAEPHCRQFAFQCQDADCECSLVHPEHKKIEIPELMSAINTDNNGLAAEYYSMFGEVIDKLIQKLVSFRKEHEAWFEQYCQMKSIIRPQVKSKILMRDFSDRDLFCGDTVARLIMGNLDGDNANQNPYKIEGKYTIKTDILLSCQKVIENLTQQLRGYWKDRSNIILMDKKVSKQMVLGFDKTLRSLNLINCEPVGRIVNPNWDKILAKLGQNYHITCLTINKCGITDENVQTICKQFKYLRTLNLQNNEITEKSIKNIMNSCPQLQCLNVNNNYLDGGLLSELIMKMKELKTLDMKAKKITELRIYPSPANVVSIGDRGCSLLSPNCGVFLKLKLRKQEISDFGAKLIAQHMKLLQELDLGLNHITDIGAQSIAWNLRNLTTLYLHENEIGDKGSRAIADGLSKLQVLQLRNNRIASQGALYLVQKLDNLQTLGLSNNLIDAKGIQEIARKLQQSEYLTVFLLNNNFKIEQCSDWIEQQSAKVLNRLHIVSRLVIAK